MGIFFTFNLQDVKHLAVVRKMSLFLNLFIGFFRPHCGEAPGRDSNPGRAAQDHHTSFSENVLYVQGEKGKKMEIATVIAPYTATSKEQLSLAQVSW